MRGWKAIEEFTFKLERIPRDGFRIGTTSIREVNTNKLSNTRGFSVPLCKPLIVGQLLPMHLQHEEQDRQVDDQC